MSDNKPNDSSDIPTAEESEFLNKDASEMTREELWNQMLVHVDEAQSRLESIEEAMDEPPIQFNSSSMDQRNRTMRQKMRGTIATADLLLRLHSEFQSR